MKEGTEKLRNELMRKANNQVKLLKRTKQIAILALILVSSVMISGVVVYYYQPLIPFVYMAWPSAVATVIMILGEIFLPFGKASKKAVDEAFNSIFTTERASCLDNIIITEARLAELKEREELFKDINHKP